MKIEDMQKELQQMGDHVKRLQASLAQMAREQVKEVQAGEDKEAFFAGAERMGAAYPLEGHVIGQAEPKAKEAYLSLLLFTWSLLKPEAKAADAGLVTVARIRASLSVDASLYDLFCHMKEASGNGCENWFQKIDRAGGKSAYLLDTLVMWWEMKAESDISYGKLSQLYLLMGCKKSMLDEAIEAARLIYERDRYQYVQGEKHKWKSFDGKVGECYLDLVGDLNTPGQVAPSSYYAMWPERTGNATGVSKYAPKVMLKIEVAEGTKVEKGQTLFTVYGAKESLKRGFLSGKHNIMYSGASDWGYIFLWKYNRRVGILFGRRGFFSLGATVCCSSSKDDSADIRNEKKQLEECILNSYEIFSMKADRDGIVHWQPWVKRDPFWCIKKIEYDAYYGDDRADWESAYQQVDKLGPLLGQQKPIGGIGWEEYKEGNNSIHLQPGDVFVSSDSMTPATIGNMPICIVEKM